MTKYSFGWDDRVAVDCPKMDEFMNELIALCERRGIGFAVKHEADYSSELTLVAFEDADFSPFMKSTEGYCGGVPWLDEAMAEYHMLEKEADDERARRKQIERDLAEKARLEWFKATFG